MVLLCLGGVVFAKDLDFQEFSARKNASDNEARKIQIFAEISPKKKSAGGKISVTVHGRIDASRHIYSVFSQGEFAPEPTKVLISSPLLKPVGAVKESKPVKIKDQAFGINLFVHKNEFWIQQEYRVLDSVKKGSYQLEGVLTYQICDNRICSLPKREPFPFLLTIH